MTNPPTDCRPDVPVSATIETWVVLDAEPKERITLRCPEHGGMTVKIQIGEDLGLRIDALTGEGGSVVLAADGWTKWKPLTDGELLRWQFGSPTMAR